MGKCLLTALLTAGALYACTQTKPTSELDKLIAANDFRAAEKRIESCLEQEDSSIDCLLADFKLSEVKKLRKAAESAKFFDMRNKIYDFIVDFEKKADDLLYTKGIKEEDIDDAAFDIGYIIRNGKTRKGGSKSALEAVRKNFYGIRGIEASADNRWYKEKESKNIDLIFSGAMGYADTNFKCDKKHDICRFGLNFMQERVIMETGNIDDGHKDMFKRVSGTALFAVDKTNGIKKDNIQMLVIALRQKKDSEDYKVVPYRIENE